MLDYNKMFADTKAELAGLQAAKANLENKLTVVNGKIDAMITTYNAIAPLVGEQPIPSLSDALLSTNMEALKAAGISVTVRSVLDAAPQEDFTAANIRDKLESKGWDWSTYVNPLSTIQTVLVRLVASGAAEEGTRDGKKLFYSAKRLTPTQPPPVSKTPPPPIGSGRYRETVNKLIAPVKEKK